MSSNSVLEYGHTKKRLEEEDILEPKQTPRNKASTSLLSIPNSVKLSMLNSGFISISKFSSEFIKIPFSISESKFT